LPCVSLIRGYKSHKISKKRFSAALEYDKIRLGMKKEEKVFST